MPTRFLSPSRYPPLVVDPLCCLVEEPTIDGALVQVGPSLDLEEGGALHVLPRLERAHSGKFLLVSLLLHLLALLYLGRLRLAQPRLSFCFVHFQLAGERRHIYLRLERALLSLPTHPVLRQPFHLLWQLSWISRAPELRQGCWPHVGLRVLLVYHSASRRLFAGPEGVPRTESCIVLLFPGQAGRGGPVICQRVRSFPLRRSRLAILSLDLLGHPGLLVEDESGGRILFGGMASLVLGWEGRGLVWGARPAAGGSAALGV